MKRKPTEEEWKILTESMIPKLIHKAKAGDFNPETINSTIQKLIEGKTILEFKSTITIPEITEKFVASEKFIINIDNDAPVKILHLSDHFKSEYLTKIEEPIGRQTLRYAELLETSTPGPIVDELGGEDRSTTTLSQMYYLMRLQRDGKSGVLLNKGEANAFFIPNTFGVVKAVSFSWHIKGWSIYTRSVRSPKAWFGGRRVFYLDSAQAAAASAQD
jgi:hypothetical protein